MAPKQAKRIQVKELKRRVAEQCARADGLEAQLRERGLEADPAAIVEAMREAETNAANTEGLLRCQITYLRGKIDDLRKGVSTLIGELNHVDKLVELPPPVSRAALRHYRGMRKSSRAPAGADRGPRRAERRTDLF